MFLNKYKVLVVSAGFGLLFWIIDAVLDHLFFLEGTMMGLLITDVPPHEVYIRCVAFVCFVVFGVLVSSVMAKRRRAEEALKESEEKYRQLVDLAQEGIWAIDKDSYTTFVNPSMAKMLGYRADEMIGKHLFSFMDERGVEIATRNVERRKQGIAEQHDSEYLRKDGSRITVTMEATPIIDQGGDYAGAIAGMIDITARAQMENALRKNEALLNRSQAIAHVGSWEMDVVANRLAWSDEVYRMFGLRPQEFDATYEAFLDAVHPDDRAATDAAYSGSLHEGRDTYEIEHRIVRRDSGEIRFVQEKCEHVKDASDQVVRSIGVVQDITERVRAEEALEDSRRFLDSVLESIQDGISVLDTDLTIRHVNKVMNAWYSVRLPLEGKKCFQCYHNASEPCDPCPSLRCIKTGKTEMDIVPGPPDSQVEWIELFSYPIIDPRSDKVTGVVEFVRDITERRRAEEALREERDFAESLVNTAQAITLVLDMEGRIVRFNPYMEALSGYSLAEVQGQDWFSTFLPAQDHSRIRDVFQETAADIQTSGTVNAIVTKDGRERQIEWYNKTLRDAAGSVVGVLAIGQDITERVDAEEERELLLAQIREQVSRIQQTIDTVPEGVLLMDAEHRVLLANPVAEKHLAVLTDAKMGDTLTRLGEQPLAEFLTSPPDQGLWHEVKADGRTFEVIARPMENGPGPENWVLVIRNVTEEREIEQRLRQQERLAAVGQLAAGIAHDFNNIMAVIVLYTQMGLRLPDIPVKFRERLETVARQADRATDLIQQILDFSRRSVLERRPMDLTPFLKEVVRLLERTIAENVRINLNYGTAEYTVNADPTRMQQAIMNLVFNARDAMLPTGGGELTITLARVAETDEIRCVTCGHLVGGEWVLISVADKGSGIPPDTLPHLFEPFFTTKEVGKGTGLGLAQVYGIVKQHEGHIDVSTEMGAGTTFTLYLPALLERPPEASPPDSEAFVEGQGETILIVEDDDTLREALADILELLNYRVLEAANGRDALDILDQHPGEIALVLSDLVMPEMGGQALFGAMRQRGLTLPVVMLSGHPMEHELKSLQAQGLAGWMLKPPDPQQLAQLLARALR